MHKEELLGINERPQEVFIVFTWVRVILEVLPSRRSLGVGASTHDPLREGREIDELALRLLARTKVSAQLARIEHRLPEVGLDEGIAFGGVFLEVARKDLESGARVFSR